jgi:hypothetical protein
MGENMRTTHVRAHTRDITFADPSFKREEFTNTIRLVRVPYGKENTPKDDREYRVEGKGAVGTIREFLHHLPDYEFEIIDDIEGDPPRIVKPVSQTGSYAVSFKGHSHFASKETRDAVFKELKAAGYKVRKTSTKSQEIDPRYVEDSGVTEDLGLGNERRYYPVLYNIEQVNQ